jgi:hypothetical protein
MVLYACKQCDLPCSTRQNNKPEICPIDGNRAPWIAISHVSVLEVDAECYDYVFECEECQQRCQQKCNYRLPLVTGLCLALRPGHCLYGLEADWTQVGDPIHRVPPVVRD